MRLHELKQDKELLDKARKLLNGAVFKQVILPMLEKEHPGRYSSNAWGLEARAIWQARTSGYQRVLNIFELLLSDKAVTSAQQSYNTLESTYESPYARRTENEQPSGGTA